MVQVKVKKNMFIFSGKIALTLNLILNKTFIYIIKKQNKKSHLKLEVVFCQYKFYFVHLPFRITLATESVLRHLSLFSATLSLRHRRRQADQLAGDQQLLPPQQDRLSDDV